ncbi:MAG: hypothetical protein ACYC92_11660 [Candidatus Acidiferrales bacterium]
MTLCVGFQSGMSVVLAANRQLTKGDLKFYETKVSAISGGDWALGFAYADSRELMGFVWDRVRRKTDRVSAEFSVFRYMLEDVLREAFERFPDADLQMLCGVSINNNQGIGSELLTMSRHGVHSTDRWEFIGIGDSPLIRYLGDTLKPMSAREEIILTVYMLRHAKKYIAGVGGETDILLMEPGKPPNILEQSEIADLERAAARLDEEMETAFRKVSQGYSLQELQAERTERDSALSRAIIAGAIAENQWAEPETLRPASGVSIVIDKFCTRFQKVGADNGFGNKPIVDCNGESLYPELAILRLLQRHGFDGVWIDSYRNKCWTEMAKSISLPDHAQREYDRILRERNGHRGGFWDVMAWKDGQYLFIELKQSSAACKDVISQKQTDWLEAAMKVGPFHFFVCEWDYLD